jgi:nicotinamidase-related amidase
MSLNAIRDHAALIVVDVQKALNGEAEYYGGKRSNPQAEANMQRILAAWRESGRPVVIVKHNSTLPQSPMRPGQPGNALQDGFEPLADDIFIEKTVNSAFIGTNLEATLRDAGIQQLVIVGMTTNHCVSTTTRMAGNLGFETYLIGDATATYGGKLGDTVFSAQTIHETALASLHNEFATVMTTDDFLVHLTATS